MGSGRASSGKRVSPDGRISPGGRVSPYSTPSATREVLERHGLFTKYGLGQNFLVNDDVLKKILDLAEIGPTDSVLEVGPGIGTLTAALLQHAAHVTAVEKDYDLPAVLADTLAPWAERFTLINKDALDLSADELPDPKPCKLVANLPYAVAATVVLDYLQRFEFLQSAVVMVQKEVADRMMAKAGSKTYGAYTVKLGLVAKPGGRFPVSAGNFFPPPRVESAVIRLDRMMACDDEGESLSPALLASTCEMADAAFATRRKTLANSCKTYFANRPDFLEKLPRMFDEAGIDARRRGETLTQQEFIRLGKALRSGSTACSGNR